MQCWLPWVEGEGKGKLFFNGYRVSDLQDEKSSGGLFPKDENIVGTMEHKNG